MKVEFSLLYDEKAPNGTEVEKRFIWGNYSHISRTPIRIKAWAVSQLVFYSKKAMNTLVGSELFCLKMRRFLFLIGCSDSGDDSVRETVAPAQSHRLDRGSCERPRAHLLRLLCHLHTDTQALKCLGLKQVIRGEAVQVYIRRLICFVCMFPLMDTKPQQSIWGSGRCLVGARRDAASCSHDWLTLSTRDVKRGRGCTPRLIPPTALCRCLSVALCGLVAHTMLLFCPQLAWGERTLARYSSQVKKKRSFLYQQTLTDALSVIVIHKKLTRSWHSESFSITSASRFASVPRIMHQIHCNKLG